MKFRATILLTGILVLALAVTGLAYEADYDFGEVDFGGETVTFVGWYDYLEDFREGGEYAGRLEEAKERFNIGEVEYLAGEWDGLTDLMMSRLMGGDAGYDIWMVHGDPYMELMGQNALYPISNLVGEEYYTTKPEPIQAVAEYMSLRGEKYVFSNADDFFATLSFIAWNKDLFEREGLASPEALYQTGEWDWDNFGQIAIEATRDTTGDGEVDQWGISDISTLEFAMTNGARVTRQDEDGNWTFAFDEEPALNALSQIKEWSVTHGVAAGDWQGTSFNAGNAAMRQLAIWEMGDDEGLAGADFDWGIVPLPQGPDADSQYWPTGGVDTLVIPVDAAQPEALLALDDFLFRNDEYWIDKEDYMIENAVDQFAFQIMEEALYNWEGEAFWVEGVIGPDWDDSRNFGAALGAVLYEDEAPASAMGAAAPAIQEELNEFFGQ